MLNPLIKKKNHGFVRHVIQSLNMTAQNHMNNIAVSVEIIGMTLKWVILKKIKGIFGTMKVRELIAELIKLPGESEVILQKDSEGNGYSPLYCVDGDAIYMAENSYSGEVYSTEEEWDADWSSMEKEDWNEMMSGPRCVVLAPY
jgi:hypothetical protein